MVSKAIDILRSSKSQGVHLFLENGQLQVKYVKETGINQQLLADIRANKEILTNFLKDHKVDSNLNNNHELPLQGISRNPDQRIPLSFTQERLWFIDRLEGSTQYHMPAVLRLRGKLNHEALKYALLAVITRHEVVRTVYREEEGKAYQHIMSPDRWNLDIIEGSCYKSDNTEVKQLIQQLIARPFDLSQDYMLRADLIALDTDDFLLVVNLHHIASDGWSRSVLVTEVLELYRSYEEKKEPQLMTLPLQYADFAIWQRKYLSGEVLEQKLDYWREKLNEVAPLDLPTDYTRPAVQGTKGATANFRVDKLLSEKLQEFSQRQGATLFMTLITAFKVLLYRYTGQQDICVATPIAGRLQPELEGLIGFFANTLALRSNINDDVSFLELLAQVRRTTMEAQQLQEVPFEKVVEAVVKERTLSRSPLTQVLFALQNLPESPELKIGEMEFSREAYDHTTAMFDISFFVSETEKGLGGLVEYSTELFKAETIEQMIKHFINLLTSIVNSPKQKVSELQILDKNEIELLGSFNYNRAQYPDKNIVKLIEEQAEKSPENVALIFDDRRITYKQLNEKANKLAHYLQSKGIGQEMIVPICLERGIEMVIGIIGILKAGAAYVPVDPEYPGERISFMLQDVNAKIVISSKDARAKIEGAAKVEIVEIGNNTIIEEQAVNNPLSPIETQNLAYVIYTSGSTGKPKGVMIEHGNVYEFICWSQQEFANSSFDIVYACTSMCFDLSVFEIFYPLSIGKPVRIIENGLHIGKHLKDDTNVLTNSVPVVIENLLREGRDLANISVINMAGEPVPLHLQQNLDTERIEVRNLYGPTEDTTYSTIYRLNKGMPILIGKPISNSSIYILSRKGRLAPVGVAGEICIGGAGVARGYLNRPELTKEKFTTNFYRDESGTTFNPKDKIYRTGDLGRWLPDGNIEYIGRIDDQVKIRGFRIELGEVETAFNELSQVATSTVVVKKREDGANTLVSYFVPDKKVVKDKERQLYQAQVLSWKEVYEIEYGLTEGEELADEEFNIVGWNDSFNEEAISEQQMREWVNEIADRILSLHPENVLEIGCGTGLIYYQVAGKIKKYIGTNFSESLVNQIREHINKGSRNYGPTELFVAAAHEIKLSEQEKVDTVILNSIVQYFPGEEYMNDVIGNCINILKGKGKIVIGDVRDNRLLPLFKGRLHLDKMPQSVEIKEFKWAIDQAILKEEELCLSPAYFYKLKSVYPEITHVDIRWKNVSFVNELSLYRFTVVIYLGIELPVNKPDWVSLSDKNDYENTITQIEKRVNTIALKDVINPRLWKERQLAKAMKPKVSGTVSDLILALENEEIESSEVRNLLNRAEAEGYQCILMPATDPLKINVLLEREPGENFIEQLNDSAAIGDGALTNIPLFTDICLLLQKDIRATLKQRLPGYMIPSEMIPLAELPLNANGKIDRKFLTGREDLALINRLNYQPPQTELQVHLVEIWQDLLRIERVGIQDNFFELGGHSLLVMRLISAVGKKLNIQLAIKDLFVHSTILKLAGFIESIQSTSLVLPPVEVVQRPEKIPLSFSQERLWFVDRIGGSLSFHVPAVLKLSGRLNKEALSYALETVVDRHEVLRTIFLDEAGIPYQFIQEKDNWELMMTDGSSYESSSDTFQKYIEQKISAPFNLAADHPLRAELVGLKEDEHVLIITIHHIASDAWSLGILVKEVVEFYKAFDEQRPASLSTLEIQYADFAIWQRKFLAGELLNNKLNYWKEKLSGVEALQIPTDFSRPPAQSSKGTTIGFSINKKTAEQLKALSQQKGSTLFMTLLAAFEILLHRYSGQQDICIGTSIAGRQQQEIENLIGIFVNILALRTKINPEESFIDFLAKVKQTTLEAYEHQEVPFEKVVDAIVKERDISRTPLFQVLFVMLNTPEAPEISLGDLTLSGVAFKNTSSKYDISFFVSESSKGLSLSVEYCTELFTVQTITRMVSHLNNLLGVIIADPTSKISDYSIITEEENQLLNKFNDRTLVYPNHKTIIEIFEKQVEISPNAIALVFENQQITYQQLNERSNQLGLYLRSKGVTENAFVALLMERSLEMMVGILGILKAGGAYVPIDASYPAERLKFILADTNAAIVLTDDKSAANLPSTAGLEVININSEWAMIAGHDNANPSLIVHPDSLAYVIYTSGSTGTPKGVMVEQRNVVSLVRGVDYVSLSSREILLSTGSSSFDATTFEYWSMLLNGGKLILCPEEKLLDHKILKEEITKGRVTKMWFTSGWFNQLVDADITLFESLETILVGGEKLSPNHISKVRKKYPALEIINGYGPTENTTFSLTYNITETEFPKLIPIGRPLNNRTAFIVDENLNLVPIGVSGEICLGGDGLSQGYLNRPELTKEKFIKNPWDGRLMYRTGDVGRWLSDGNIEYLGRRDDQVKLRGYRIELGEIENVLLKCDLVQNATVVINIDEEQRKKLVGYIVPNGDFDRSGLLDFLASKLPEYMVPAILVQMESLPLNANGKIDKKALPDPALADLTDKEFERPRNEKETVLAEIWKDLLGLDGISIHDNFFELGGDSLLAIRVVSAIRKQLEVEMPISNLFEFQTIASLSKQLQVHSEVGILPAIQATSRPDYIPLSFSQERLWFIDHLDGSQQYHIPAVLRLKGALNIQALSYSLRSLVNRHEVLRTVFLAKAGYPYQYIKDEAEWELPVTDGSRFRDDLPGLRQLIQQMVSNPFDLSKDNMFRANLVRLVDTEHILIVTLHHIASDGWSRSIMVKEVAEFYNAFTEDRAPHLSPLAIQYADFAIWQRSYFDDTIFEKKLAYWQENLKGATSLQMPIDFPRPAVQTTRGASVKFDFDKKLLEALQELSQRRGSTLFMTLLAALKVLLHRYSGQEDICVGTAIAGRQQHEIEGLIGFFVNTLAIRTEFQSEQSFTSLIEAVKKTTLEAYENQEVPFEKVVDAVVTKRDRSRNPIFQVMFVLQNTPDVPSLELGDLELSSEGYDHTTAQFDLSFSITEHTNGLSGSVEYNIDIYKKETIERLINHFGHLLISIVNNDEEKICDLKIMADEEVHQLLYEFNSEMVGFSKDKTIVDLFLEQSAATPDSIAIVFESQHLTYKRLNERSNQLANYLRNNGVKADTLVPICIERGIDMIVGLLGILKAGGAYIPIDPDYPIERIAYILEDTAAPLVVTSRESKIKLLNVNNIEIVEIDGHGPAISKESINDLAKNICSSNLAYVIYTSGSTGKPKGVLIEHRNLVRLFKTENSLYDFTERDVWSMAHSFCFDFSVWEMYGALLYGGRLIIVPTSVTKDSSLFSTLLQEQQVTVLNQTPSAFYVLQDSFINTLEQTSIRYVIFGGEALNPEKLRPWKKLYPSCKLINMYGITETTVHVTYQEITMEDINLGKSLIGKPIPTLTVHILDRHHQLLPIGVPGELCIGGAGLARGYLNRPSLTAQKFIPDSLSQEHEARLYKSGDLGVWLPDGNIEYLGRIDDQVKIRGYRIEPGEIAAILLESGQVKQVVVVASEDGENNQRLIAYIVPETNLDKNRLTIWLHSKIPDYMIPSVWIEMESLPLTSNGKIDKKSLPPPDIGGMLSYQYVGPGNESEGKLVSIWKQILRVNQIGIHDDFFELGGHSLLIMRLISAIRREFEIELAVQDLFLYPTVAQLAGYLQRSHIAPLPIVEQYVRPEHIPLSFSQERLWFIDQLEGSVQYNSPTVLRLKGSLNLEALNFALKNIVTRHEALRTVFYEQDGNPYQAVIDPDNWNVSILDGKNYKGDRASLHHVIEKTVTVPFDLSKDYMLRADLISVDEQEYVLVVTMHHIASDDWSLPIIVKEVVECYSSCIEKRAPVLPRLKLQYADYAMWQRKYLAGEVIERKIGYWKQKLNGVSPLNLPTDFSRPPVRTLRGASVNMMIEKDLSDNLIELSNREQTTLYMTLLAIYNLLLQRYCGQEDICVGASIANRPQAELEDLVGFFVNTVALRNHVEENDRFIDFLQQVKSSTLEAYSNQEVPFERVVEEVVKERDPARSALFQVMLVLLNTPGSKVVEVGKLELSPEPLGIKISKYDITFHMSQSEQGLPITIVYNTDLFKEETIIRMGRHFKHLLYSAVKDPNQTLDLLQMLTAEEEQQLLVEFN